MTSVQSIIVLSALIMAACAALGISRTKTPRAIHIPEPLRPNGSQSAVCPMVRQKNDITITAFSKMAGFVLKAAEELTKRGINAEVINLRSIRTPDRDTINAFVRKTSRLLTAEEAWSMHGVGAEICAFQAWWKKALITSGADVPMSNAANLERLAVPRLRIL